LGWNSTWKINEIPLAGKRFQFIGDLFFSKIGGTEKSGLVDNWSSILA
jgi:hypothetical protein